MSALVVATPVGDARAHVVEPVVGAPRSTVVLGHGAGGGVDARDLVALAEALPRHGHRVVLVEQPWRVAGRTVAPAPATLDVGWLAVMERLRSDGVTGGAPLVVGGRSAGARVACRTADAIGVDAVLALSFPLHPPGRPDRSRADELAGAMSSSGERDAGALPTAGARPVLVVQGERDPFGSPDEVRAAVAGVAIVAVPAADHGFKVPKSGPCTQAEAVGLIGDAVVRAMDGWFPRLRTRRRG